MRPREPLALRRPANECYGLPTIPSLNGFGELLTAAVLGGFSVVKLLHVGFGFSPWHGGGLLTYAEDMMRAQAEAGHAVGYFCVGRNYPLLGKPRVHRWSRDGIRVFELLNSPSAVGGDWGNHRPDQDLSEPHAERLFRRTFARFAPDVVHIQELGGLPSSLIDIAHEEGAPVVMTLQDYFPLCPTHKLFDHEERLCMRIRPGEHCTRCCRDAPTTSVPRDLTRQYERARHPRLYSLQGALRERMRRGEGQTLEPSVDSRPADRRVLAPAGDYQRRRDVNVMRLGEIDALVAMSSRVESIYEQLGVSPDRLRTLALTVGHLADLVPRDLGQPHPPDGPVRFATLNGAASTQKGAELLVDAVRRLAAMGLAERDFCLSILGDVSPSVGSALRSSPTVEFCGRYRTADLNSLLDHVDVGLVPSVWEEAYGYVGLEFLAKGIPVLGNALGGITDYVRPGETGWLNRDCDGQGFAAIMASLIRGPAEIWRLQAQIAQRRSQLIKPIAMHQRELMDVYKEAREHRGRATS